MMRLHGAFDAKFNFISSLIIVRLVSPSVAMLVCLQILIVQKTLMSNTLTLNHLQYEQ